MLSFEMEILTIFTLVASEAYIIVNIKGGGISFE
jgi:hypothetical protein